jgi:carboxymethylenebutenolidase
MPDLPYPGDGGVVHGHLAVPGGPGTVPPPERWPGVVVIHELFGLTEGVRQQADRLASEGYLAFAPDLYSGKPWLRCVRGTFQQLRAGSGPAFTAIEAARAWLASRPDCSGTTGVIGFCMGGGLALLMAPGGKFDASSVNYGSTGKWFYSPEVLRGACPVVGSFGAKDKGLKGAAAKLDKALTEADVPHDVKEYPEATHGFLNDHSVDAKLPRVFAVAGKFGAMGYHDESARDARERIAGFFAEHLTP